MNILLPSTPDFLKDSKKGSKKPKQTVSGPKEKIEKFDSSELPPPLDVKNLNEVQSVQPNTALPEPILEITTKESEGLPWKDILKDNSNSNELLLQREWGLLTERARGLAPETEWSFLWIGHVKITKSLVTKWRTWFEELILSPSWEEPEQMEVTLSSSNGVTTFNLRWTKNELPPPIFSNLEGWRILPSSTENYYCFTISYIETFVSYKVGIS